MFQLFVKVVDKNHAILSAKKSTQNAIKNMKGYRTVAIKIYNNVHKEYIDEAKTYVIVVANTTNIKKY